MFPVTPPMQSADSFLIPVGPTSSRPSLFPTRQASLSASFMRGFNEGIVRRTGLQRPRGLKPAAHWSIGFDGDDLAGIETHADGVARLRMHAAR